jgi:hypothetical protein
MATKVSLRTKRFIGDRASCQQGLDLSEDQCDCRHGPGRMGWLIRFGPSSRPEQVHRSQRTGRWRKSGPGFGPGLAHLSRICRRSRVLKLSESLSDNCRGQSCTDVISKNEKPPLFGGFSLRGRRDWWRRRELNPRPEASRERLLHAQPLLSSRSAASRRGKTAAGQPRIGFAGPSGDPDRLHPHLASAYGTRRVRFPDTVTAR